MKKAIKYLLCVSIIVLTLTGCGRVPKLKDGSELVFELNGLKMTTEDFYQELKDNYGTQSLINAIDGLLLNKVYETTTDMKTKIDSQVTQLKNQYGSDFQDFLSYNNIASEKALKNLLEMSYKRELAIKDYAATLITDKDIEKYYNEKTIGDIKASHILIKSEATDDMTDEEKAEDDNAVFHLRRIPCGTVSAR